MLHSDSCVERTERMRLFSYFSDLIIPVFMLYIVAHGLVARRDIYNDFLDGAKDGLKTVVDDGCWNFTGIWFSGFCRTCAGKIVRTSGDSGGDSTAYGGEDVFFQCCGEFAVGYF